MRNLKRALSLALASVMVLGMMVVGASATSFDDFSDKDKVVNVEAVSILNTLNVINGKDDGSFDPTGIVTRAEMAKMICVVLNGGKDPNLGTAATTSYTDTVGTWAAAYIEFCTNQKIVSGDGAGKFNPTNTVTGAEAAKMLLVAMGYSAEYEKMVGAQWATSVNVLANTKGLYSGLDIDPGLGLTRDNAAQMIYNALNAKMVTYKSELTTDGSSFSTIVTKSDMNGTILTEKFKAVRVEGVIVDNDFVNNGKGDKTTIEFSNYDEVYAAGYAFDGAVATSPATNSATFEIASGKDEFGKAIILYVKPSTASPKNAAKAEVISGLIMDESNNTVVSTVKAFDTDDTLTDWGKGEGVKLDSSDLPTFYVNYDNDSAVVSAAGFDKDYVNANGKEVVLIDNDGDGKAEIALLNTSTFGKVTKYTTKDDGSIIVAGGTGSSTLNSTDAVNEVVGFEDVKKDDFVNYTKVDDTWYVTKAESVTGTLEEYKLGKTVAANDTNTSLTVDGEKYTTSAATTYYNDSDISGVRMVANFDADANVDYEGTFYFDGFGLLIAAGDVETANAFAFIANTEWVSGASSLSGGTLRVYAILEDGTSGTYEVTKINNTDPTPAADAAYTNASGAGIRESLVKYNITDDDEMEITRLSAGPALSDKATGTYASEKNKISTTINGAAKKASSSTVYFYVSTKADGTTLDEINVFVGKDNAPTVTSASLTSMAALDADSTANVKAVMVYANTVSSSDYVYIYNYAGSNGNGAKYDAIIDGELVTGIQSNSSTKLANGLYEYTMTSKNFYKFTSKVSGIYTGVVTALDGKSIMVDGNEYKLTGDYTVAYIDGGDTYVEATVNKKDYVTVAYSDNEIEGIYILEEFDAGNSNIKGYDLTGDITAISESAKALTITAAGGSTTVGDLKSALKVSGGAEVVVTSAAYDAANPDANIVTDSTTLTTGHYVTVVSEDGSFTAYTIASIA